MDPGVMAAREQVARERLARAAEVLAARFGVAGLEPLPGNNRQVLALKRLEGVARLLEELVARTAQTSTEEQGPAQTPKRPRSEKESGR